MKQIERIEHMEQNLERATDALRALNDALDEYETVQEALHELDTYYGSDTWKQDFSDDEQGRLPHTLKRGVLSEDGIYDVLSDHYALTVRLLDTVSGILKNR